MQTPIIDDILTFLDADMPFDTAEDYDNVGLIVGNKGTKVKKILCALDCTPEVVLEAKKLNSNLIISHHPLMFRPINKIDPMNYEGDAISKLLKYDISLISMHTNLDKSFLSPSLAMAKKIKNADVVEFDAYIAIVELKNKISEDELIENVRKSLSPNLSFYGKNGKFIKKIAFGGGACSDAYMLAKKHNADILITGEVKHNHAIEAQHEGIKMLEIGHYYSEVVLVEPFSKYLQTRLDALQYNATVGVSMVVPF